MPAKHIACGRFLKPFGILGEIRFDPYFPGLLEPEDLESGFASKEEPDEASIPVSISSGRIMPKFWVLTVERFSTPEDASRLTNKEFFVERSELPDLKEGEYYEVDLIGLEVVEEDGKELGKLTSVLATGANDVWEVTTPEGKEVLLPVIDDVIISVDIEKGLITVRLMEGLID